MIKAFRGQKTVAEVHADPGETLPVSFQLNDCLGTVTEHPVRGMTTTVS